MVQEKTNLKSMGASEGEIFHWLAIHDRIWTPDRRLRHGLQASAGCKLCDQAQETPDHLFISCNFTRQVWHAIQRMSGQFQLPTPDGTMLEWWLLLRSGSNRTKQKGIDSAFMLISWCIWKEHNKRVFDNVPGRTGGQMVEHILHDGHLWTMAGAKNMAAIGWPAPAVVRPWLGAT